MMEKSFWSIQISRFRTQKGQQDERTMRNRDRCQLQWNRERNDCPTMMAEQA